MCIYGFDILMPYSAKHARAANKSQDTRRVREQRLVVTVVLIPTPGRKLAVADVACGFYMHAACI